MDNGGGRVKAACRLSADELIDRAMNDRPSKPAPKSDHDRAARLAEALRVNLHRRKAQARAVERETRRDDDSGQ